MSEIKSQSKTEMKKTTDGKSVGHQSDYTYIKVDMDGYSRDWKIDSKGTARSFLKSNVEVKVGDVLGTLPISLHPASTRNFRLIGNNLENIKVIIDSNGVIKVTGISKYKDIKNKQSNERESVDKAVYNNGCMHYDLKDRKEIEIIEHDKVMGIIEISIPKRAGLKNGDIVGKVSKEIFPSGNRNFAIVDINGDLTCLVIDSEGIIKVGRIRMEEIGGIDEAERTVSWNQSVIDYVL